MMDQRERRRYQHVPFATPLTVVDEATGRRYHGSSINLSRGGVGFFCEKFIPSNTRIACVFHLGHGPNRLDERVAATVRWAKVDSGGAICGAAFAAPLSRQLNPVLSDRLFETVG